MVSVRPSPLTSAISCVAVASTPSGIAGAPHAHARITAIDTAAAEALPGVHLVLDHRNVVTPRFSTGRHEHREDDPDDTLVFDDTVRFVGQRVAAVVAANPAQVAQYRGGKHQVIGFFVGQVMKATQGKANPQLVNDLLKKMLAG